MAKLGTPMRFSVGRKLVTTCFVSWAGLRLSSRQVANRSATLLDCELTEFDQGHITINSQALPTDLCRRCAIFVRCRAHAKNNKNQKNANIVVGITMPEIYVLLGTVESQQPREISSVSFPVGARVIQNIVCFGLH